LEDHIKTLTSLAILKVDLDEGHRDYLDYLTSFVIYSIDKHKPDPVTDGKIAKLLEQDFGLKIPRRGCQLVLRRLAKKGLLKKEHEIFVIKKEMPVIDFKSKRNRAKHDIEIVFNRFKTFVSEEFKEIWDENQITTTILGFLSKFGIHFLRAYIFNTALPNIPDTAPKEQFIVSKFISNLYDSHDPLFESVSILVKGQMYANALVCPDLESIQKKFNKLTFYLDTPIVLNLLSMQRLEQKDAAIELLSLLKQLKGSVSIFDHTASEIRNILKAVESNLDNPNAKGEVIRQIRKIGLKLSDIILLRENLDAELFNIGISIHRTPSYEVDLQISETELEDAISNEIIYKNPDALKFDINSIRSIYVLRKGKVPKRIEDAVAVFVTTNALLAKAAFLVGQKHTSTKEVSSAITDYSLANIAWLKAPLGAPDLPTKEMLANCYAAMEPSIFLWDKYLQQTEELETSGNISPDDHALLRVSPLAEKELMNLTLGEERALTENSIRTILDRVKANLTIEKDKILSDEKTKHENVCSERDSFKDQNTKIKKNVYWLSAKLSKIVTIIIEIVGILILGSSLLLSTFTTRPAIQSFTVSILLVFAFLYGFLNWYIGLSLKSLIKKTEAKLHNVFLKYLKQLLTR
jgi:hypothetical protein